MRRSRLNFVVCSLLAVALLAATSQYLAHFHVPRADINVAAHVDKAAQVDKHGAAGHCSLCLQFDRLPAPPATAFSAVPFYYFVATVEAERLARLALDAPRLWPPSRGPPALNA